MGCFASLPLVSKVITKYQEIQITSTEKKILSSIAQLQSSAVELEKVMIKQEKLMLDYGVVVKYHSCPKNLWNLIQSITARLRSKSLADDDRICLNERCNSFKNALEFIREAGSQAESIAKIHLVSCNNAKKRYSERYSGVVAKVNSLQSNLFNIRILIADKDFAKAYQLYSKSVDNLIKSSGPDEIARISEDVEINEGIIRETDDLVRRRETVPEIQPSTLLIDKDLEKYISGQDETWLISGEKLEETPYSPDVSNFLDTGANSQTVLREKSGEEKNVVSNHKVAERLKAALA